MTRGLPHLCPVPTQSLIPGSPLPLMLTLCVRLLYPASHLPRLT